MAVGTLYSLLLSIFSFVGVFVFVYIFVLTGQPWNNIQTILDNLKKMLFMSYKMYGVPSNTENGFFCEKSANIIYIFCLASIIVMCAVVYIIIFFKKKYAL